MTRQGKLLTGLREYHKGSPVWTYPGGHGEKGKTIESTLRRVVLEEIGIDDLVIGEYLGSKPGVKDGECNTWVCYYVDSRLLARSI